MTVFRTRRRTDGVSLSFGQGAGRAGHFVWGELVIPSGIGRFFIQDWLVFHPGWLVIHPNRLVIHPNWVVFHPNRLVIHPNWVVFHPNWVVFYRRRRERWGKA
ncbi:MAG: hypothetical protein UFP31_02620 [Prevotella sp.]|nr:hypothetical protein [Prevotella sp.]